MEQLQQFVERFVGTSGTIVESSVPTFNVVVGSNGSSENRP
jgi:hypothetical protein